VVLARGALFSYAGVENWGVARAKRGVQALEGSARWQIRLAQKELAVGVAKSSHGRGEREWGRFGPLWAKNGWFSRRARATRPRAAKAPTKAAARTPRDPPKASLQNFPLAFGALDDFPWSRRGPFASNSFKGVHIIPPKPSTARPKKAKTLSKGSPRIDRPNGCWKQGARGGAARGQKEQN
jgi:hypothetical protein